MNPRATILALLFTILSAGCSSTKVVNVGDTASLADINRKALRRELVVVMHSGLRYRASSLRLQDDSTSWVDGDTHTLIVAATREIDQLSFRDRGRGAGQGLGIGLLSGVVVGMTLPFWEPNTDCSSWNDETVLGSCGGWATAFGLVGGFLGSITGPIVGGAIGSKQTYVLRSFEPK